MSLVSELRKQLKRRGKKKLKKTPRPKSFNGIERDYGRYMKMMASVFKEALEENLIPKLGSLIVQYGAFKQVADTKRNDSFIDSLEEAMTQAGIFFYRRYTDRELQRIATQTGEKVESLNMRNFSDQFARVLEVQPQLSEPWIYDELQLFTKRNVNLIKGMTEEELSKIKTIVAQAVPSGKRAPEIAKEILARVDVYENRALLIATDQIGKFNGDLNRIRQQEVGVEKYEWSSSLDLRVRPQHAERHGKVYKWSDPPADGHPGQPIRCRCQAIPIFDE